MVRLPIPGKDEGAWGEILNTFLKVSHKGDGQLSDNTVGASQLQDKSVASTKLADGAVSNAQIAADAQISQSKVANLSDTLATKYEKPASGIPQADLASTIQDKLDSVPTNAITGDGVAKVTVGATAPTNPAVGDVWIQT